jgi:hypothetical protein
MKQPYTLKHDVLKIRDGFISLANILEENNAKTKIHEAKLQIVMAFSELRRTLGVHNTEFNHY